MNEAKTGPERLSTGERMATIGGAVTDAMQHKAKGEHEIEDGARHVVPLSEVEAVIAGWRRKRSHGESEARMNLQVAGADIDVSSGIANQQFEGRQYGRA